MHGMQVVVIPGSDDTTLVPVDSTGQPTAPARTVTNVAQSVTELESADHPRWVWTDWSDTYTRLVRSGVRVRRAHDLTLTSALLDARAGRTSAAAGARPEERQGLFATVAPPEADAVVAHFVAQAAEAGEDGQLRLLVAAESAGALAAAELSHVGLPFSASRHRRMLERELGPRTRANQPPDRLRELRDAISAAFGKRINPNSALEVLDAFAREGLDVPNTQARTLREIAHPAVPFLLRHKELSRLHATNGWAWLDTWVHEDRFHPVYVPGGTPSGRWASRGGGALQIPKLLRHSVVADSGRTFVIADAGQLEPRILAALSGDVGMMAAAGETDLYAPVAATAFGGDRSRAKVAILGTLYGATAGQAWGLLSLLRRQFPVAVDLVEAAARAGERGEVVHSLLGRASPPAPKEGYDPAARGRFTRNFVVQATAAEWALCLVADLRLRLVDLPDTELVFFQHDEVVVHCAQPDIVVGHVLAAAAMATQLLFGDTPVRFPMDVAVRRVYGHGDGLLPDAAGHDPGC